jgi:hypothetical protein
VRAALRDVGALFESRIVVTASDESSVIVT